MGRHAVTDHRGPMGRSEPNDHREPMGRRGPTDRCGPMGLRAVTDRHETVASLAKQKLWIDPRAGRPFVTVKPTAKAETIPVKTVARELLASHRSSRTFPPGKKRSAACQSRHQPKTTPAAPKAAAAAVVTAVDRLGDGSHWRQSPSFRVLKRKGPIGQRREEFATRG